MKIVLKILSILVLLVLCGGDVLADGQRQRLLIIHSYGPDYEWTADMDIGINKALGKARDFNQRWHVKRIYLNGKKYQEDPSAMRDVIEAARSEMVDYRPNAAMIFDDLAFMMYYEIARGMGIPVMFGGINGYVEDYGYVPFDLGVTGAMEHNNYAAIVRIIRSLRPSIREITFVGDASRTTDGMVKNIKTTLAGEFYRDSSMLAFSFFKTGSYEDLKSHLLKINPHYTAVIFISQYTLRDSSGRHVSRKEVDEWIQSHTRFIDAGITSTKVPYGRLISWSSSAEEMGHYCMHQLISAVEAKKDFSEVPIRKYLPMRIVLNQTRAKELGVQFTYGLLSYAQNTMRLYKMRQD